MKKTYISPVQKCIAIDAEDLIAQSQSPESAPTMNMRSSSGGQNDANANVALDVKADRGGLWDEEW